MYGEICFSFMMIYVNISPHIYTNWYYVIGRQQIFTLMHSIWQTRISMSDKFIHVTWNKSFVYVEVCLLLSRLKESPPSLQHNMAYHCIYRRKAHSMMQCDNFRVNTRNVLLIDYIWHIDVYVYMFSALGPVQFIEESNTLRQQLVGISNIPGNSRDMI